MKKQILAAAAIVALSAGAAMAASGNATAAAGAGVKNSVHDMKAAIGATDTQSRICAFCHTPHHAETSATAAPLWSRNVNGRDYTAYQSNTFDVAGSTLAPTDPAYGSTRLCLTCHDSGIASSTHYNTADTVTAKLQGDSYGGVDIGAGALLTNDHPVGFNYGSVVCSSSPSDTAVNTPGACTTGEKNWVRSVGLGVNVLKYINNTKISVGERLEGGIMTCSTCHDVHNKKNVFEAGQDVGNSYLVLAPQKGSDLCLTCHIK